MNEQQKEILNYDAMLQWIPTYNCNLNCSFCFENYQRNTIKSLKINIFALTKTLKNTKKIFKISFTGGGEPFLIPNFVEACMEIIKNHFIRITTNLTSDKVKKFSEEIDSKRVIEIHASLHIKESERLNLFDKYIHNFHMCKKKGFNIGAFEVAYPPLINEIEKYKKFFKKKDIQLDFIPFIGKYKRKNYPEAYTDREIKIFGLDLKDIKNFYPKGKLCNAGYNIGWVDPNGDIRYCFSIPKSMGNVYHRIQFNDKLILCPFEFCACPLNFQDISLYIKSIKESNSKIMNSIFLKKHVLNQFLTKGVGKFLDYEKRNQIRIFLQKFGLYSHIH